MGAALAMTAVGAIANAAAFTGGNAIYGLFNKSGGQAEQERHDKAIETLQEAQNLWSRKRAEELDYLNKVLQREKEGAQLHKDIEAAMYDYWLATGGDQDKLNDVPKAGEEPTLNDYYTPSDEQNTYEYVFIAGSIGVAGFIGYKYL